MVERHAMPGPAAPVVADEMEAVEYEAVHEGDLVAGHDPERVVGGVGRPFRLRRVAVAPQVGAHHGEPVGQDRRHLAPQGQALRVAVQQQHRRPAAGHHAVDPHVGGHIDQALLEPLEHAADPSQTAPFPG